MNHDKEIDRIKKVYEDRDATRERCPTSAFSGAVTREREAVYAEVMRSRFADLSKVRLLEIGAGDGGNLLFFNRLGLEWEHLVGNELMDHRIQELRTRCPRLNVIPGDATRILTSTPFDVVFQSTVFTSLLEEDLRVEMAASMERLVRPGGMILWYDFTVDNPRNPNVRGVSRSEIRSLFGNARSFEFRRVTLAPPIGRRLGRFYGVVNSVAPFLRTHVVAAIDY